MAGPVSIPEVMEMAIKHQDLACRGEAGQEGSTGGDGKNHCVPREQWGNGKKKARFQDEEQNKEVRKCLEKYYLKYADLL